MQLLATPAPAGFEGAAADEFTRYVSEFATVTRDPLGSCVARISQAPSTSSRRRIALYGHLDEIGLIVSKIDARGFLRCAPIGSWDPTVLVGQRVEIGGVAGPVAGVISRPGIHLLRDEGRERQAPDFTDLWIDLGLNSRESAEQLVSVGAPVVLSGPPLVVGNHLVSRSLDNRIGTLVAVEVLRRVGASADAEVIAVASVKEEIGGVGAETVTNRLSPDVAVVIDLSPASDTPVASPMHDLELGAGPGLNRGSVNCERVVDELVETAQRCGIPVQMRALGMGTSTDADRVIAGGRGVPLAFLSIPARYVHSPVEMVHLDDVCAAIDLLCAWVDSCS